jgi:hypothetical protein
MYAWIWRHLPFGRPGKIIGSLALAVATGALLWYVVFPQADQILPFYDVQVTDQNGGGQSTPGAPAVGGSSTSPAPTVRPGASGPSLGEHDIPYSTAKNNAPPKSASPSR